MSFLCKGESLAQVLVLLTEIRSMYRSALFAGAGRFRWAAQRSGDKDQRNLDNSRVLWRRNLEQNRRDVVRNGFTLAVTSSTEELPPLQYAWPSVSATKATERL